jgi:peptidoglycan/LPS O-acetylase OafA/YrhL
MNPQVSTPNTNARPSESVEPNRIRALDALRGWAILGVVAVHSTELVPPKSLFLASLLDHGKKGVQLFFVVSAISLLLSLQLRWDRERRPVRNFFLRRFFRIAPLFYAAIVLSLWFDGLSPRDAAPDGLHWWYVPLTFLFANGWFPEAQNSIVPGGWSIAAETTFYLCLPFLFLRIRNLKGAVALVALGTFIAFLWKVAMYRILADSYPGGQFQIVRVFVYLNFFGQLPVFLAGILAFHWLRAYPEGRSRFARWVGALTLPVLVLAESLSGMELNHLVYAAACTIFAVSLIRFEGLRGVPFLHPAIIAFGTRSYGIYLCHFYVLRGIALVKSPIEAAYPALHDLWAWQLGLFIAVYGCSFAIASGLQRFVERPAIQFGQRVVARLETMG